VRSGPPPDVLLLRVYILGREHELVVWPKVAVDVYVRSWADTAASLTRAWPGKLPVQTASRRGKLLRASEATPREAHRRPRPTPVTVVLRSRI
jgi:hypothetical protein